jgi:hypothetical protein
MTRRARATVSRTVVEAGELGVAPFEVDDIGRRRDGDFVTVGAHGPEGLAKTSRVRPAAALA